MDKKERVFAFEFKGNAQIRHEVEQQNEKIVQALNDESEYIIDKIKSEIKKSVPMGIDVTVQIDFYSGSIEWSGIIYIMDWFARISDNIGFIEYLTRAIRFAINKIIRNRIQREFPFSLSSTTDVVFVKEPIYQNISQRSHSNLTVLASINTLLLVAILSIILIKLVF